MSDGPSGIIENGAELAEVLPVHAGKTQLIQIQTMEDVKPFANSVARQVSGSAGRRSWCGSRCGRWIWRITAPLIITPFLVRKKQSYGCSHSTPAKKVASIHAPPRYFSEGWTSPNEKCFPVQAPAR